MVCIKDSPTSQEFQLETPFKVLYSVYALRTCLDQQLQNVEATLCISTHERRTNIVQGSIDQELIVHGVQRLAAALIAIGSPSLSDVTQVELVMSASLVECLKKFLKGDSTSTAPSTRLTTETPQNQSLLTSLQPISLMRQP